MPITIAALVLSLFPHGLSAVPEAEAALLYSALDNGDFEDEGPSFEDEDGLQRIPWWRSSHGMSQVERGEDGSLLRCGEGEWVSQPIPVYEPLLEGLRITGEVRGHGVVEITDGRGEVARFEFDREAPGFTSFTITGEELIDAMGRRPVPRLDLRLSAADAPPHSSAWRNLEVLSELPLPTEAELREELLEHLRFICQLWFDRGLDREGEIVMELLTSIPDVITGERAYRLRGGFHSFFSMLRRALEHEEVPEWRAVHETYLESVFRYCLNENTGLPQGWNAARDEPVSMKTMEVAAPLGALIDLAESEPEPWRTRALEAATRVGALILERGVRPDGSIDTRYRPSDGHSNSETSPIRKLDIPAELARLGKLTGDERFTRAALRAVRRFEYTHYWSGQWDYLDPGFDDHFGHFGARGVVMWKYHPDVPSFRQLTVKGLAYYLPIWKDAVRLGGYIAVDEVRCWEILFDAAQLDEEIRGIAREYLWPAMRAHFKSEQYHDGSWGDVTYYRWDPKVNLKVGDLMAIPQNILHGLALCYDDRVDLRTDEVRAMFTAILRTTTTRYRRPYGYLGTLTEHSGQNPGGGSIRLMLGLVEMLARLE